MASSPDSQPAVDQVRAQDSILQHIAPKVDYAVMRCAGRVPWEVKQLDFAVSDRGSASMPGRSGTDVARRGERLPDMDAARPVERERAVPVLTVLDLDEEARFYARLGFEVLHRYDGYLVLGRGDLEIHLSYWEDHDPSRTAGVVSLRVSDAQAIYDDLCSQLEQDGCLYLAPASGITPEFWDELRRRVAAGIPTVRLHEIEDKPWGLRQFSVIDMSGNAIRVGHRIRDV